VYKPRKEKKITNRKHVLVTRRRSELEKYNREKRGDYRKHEYRNMKFYVKLHGE
jgi:hypothetical protein